MRQISFAVVLLFLSGGTTAQDLIKDTQFGKEKNYYSEQNAIATKLISSNENDIYNPVSIFTCTTSKEDKDKFISSYVNLEISKKALNSLYSKSYDFVHIEIPVNHSKSFNLELMRTEIISKGYRCTTSSGKTIDASGIFYRGIVSGDPSSTASVSVFEDNVRVLISDRNGNYILGPSSKQKSQYILYNDRNLKIDRNFECFQELLPTTSSKINPADIHRSSSMMGGCIDIFVEADFAMYESHGSDADDVAEYIAALMNETMTVYENEGIDIQLSGSFIWDEEDPYADEDIILELLIQYRTTRTTFEGNLAALISTRNLGGGKAYIDVLCNKNFAYSFTSSMGTEITELPTYSWDVGSFSHELGHNFGSLHTHDCVWNDDNSQIDDCGNLISDEQDDCYDAENPIIPDEGTIMSYCHVNATGSSINLALGFGDLPGDLIRDRYNNADCRNLDCNGEEITCPEDLEITDPYISGDVEVNTASNSITAFNINNAGSNIDYLAGEYVLLTTGFHAKNGSDVFVSIEDCDSDYHDDDDADHYNSSTPDTLTQSKLRNLTKGEFRITNYPNPFSIETSIEYELVEDSEVSLFVSDFSGKIIEYLVQKSSQTKGTYIVNFNGRNYQNGLYQYTILAGEKIKVGKMILTK